jgi:hypothetical protein
MLLSNLITRSQEYMQKILTIAQRNTTLLALLVVVLVGCGRGGCTASSSSSSEFNINGWKTSSKTITRTHDGVSRRLETTTDVDIQNGQVTKFPTAALIRIQEDGGPEQREAELRENAGKLELWVKEKGNFRQGSAQEELWLERFLRDITTK